MPFIQRYVCSVSLVGFWNGPYQISLVLEENSILLKWKAAIQQLGNPCLLLVEPQWEVFSAEGEVALVRGVSVLSARAARMDIWPVWAPWGSCRHLSSRDVPSSISQLVQGQEAQDSGSPAVPGCLASPYSLGPQVGEGETGQSPHPLHISCFFPRH